MPHNDDNVTSLTRANGIRKSRFPVQASPTLAGSTFDYVTESTNFKITFEALQALLVGTPGAKNIVEIAADYTMDGTEDIIIGTGIITISLISAALADRDTTFIADTGSTVVLLPNGTDTIPSAVITLTSEQSTTLVPTTNNKWVRG